MIAGLLLWMLSLPMQSAAAPSPPPCAGNCVVFTFDWPLSKVPKYTMVLQEDLVTRYWEGDSADAAPQRPKAALSVSPETLAKIMAARAEVASNCETKEKNVAQTGKKTLQFYAGDDVQGCTFNYSDKTRLNDVITLLQRMAETIQAGDRLKHARRFDRLGLDAELDALVEAAKEGRVIELQNIAPMLQSIVEDEELMSPSRRKAETLLQMGQQRPGK